MNGSYFILTCFCCCCFLLFTIFFPIIVATYFHVQFVHFRAKSEVIIKHMLARIVRESDYSPAAALLYMEKA